MKRNLRPRNPGQYVSQQEWELGKQDEDDLILGRRYNVLEKFHSTKYQVDYDFVHEMQGKAFNMKYLQEDGFTQPMVFRSSTGLGMRMPSPELSVPDIKKLVGSRRKVDVIDTLTQESSSMSLGQWSKYYETFPRQRILNVISLEFSCTKLDPLVEAPEMVRRLDWVEKVWPKDLKKLQTNPTNDLNKMMYPKVQKYCLMSVAGCYTDFHLDFGGTSVWYHVLKGEKQFLLMPPSSETYSLFQHWQMSGEQEGVFLAELMGKAQLVHLHAGDTFVMPSGWIHAVYTPSDSIVFGGNFLHSFNIPQQLLVHELEQDTKVPSELRYPFFGSIHWYMLQNYTKELQRLAIKKNSDSSTVDENHDSLTQNARWLKEISVEKLAILSTVEKIKHLSSQGSNLESVTPLNTQSNTNLTPSHSEPYDLSEFNKPITPTKEMNDSDMLEATNDSDMVDVSKDSEATNDSDMLEEECLFKNFPPSHTLPKPHLSPYERGGLLLLIQKMKNNLFEQNIPVSFSPTGKLLADLEKLLQSALSQEIHSLVPTGVGVLDTGKLDSQGHHTPLKCKLPRKRCSGVGSPESKRLAKMNEEHDDDDGDDDEALFKEDSCEENEVVRSGHGMDIPPSLDTHLSLPPPSTKPLLITLNGSPSSPVTTSTDLSSRLMANSPPADVSCDITASVQIPTLMAAGGLLCALSPILLEYKEETIAKIPNPAYSTAVIQNNNC